MKKDSVTIGIDERDGTYFVARVDQHTGRPDIKALIRFDAEHFNGHHLLEGNRIVVSFPDNQTMIKHIRLQSEENALLKVRFELETAQLDKPDNFLYDVIPTKIDNYYLGLTIRKELTHKLIGPFIKQNGDVDFTSGGVMRAAALARGFLTYCQQSGGEFGAIVDFGSKSASIAFYYKQQIVDLGGLPIPSGFHQNNDAFQNLIIELKTLINYKLAELLENGISVPLSKLFVIGEFIDDKRIDALGKNLRIEIARPEIHAGFISDSNKNREISLDKYLVALGLTVV